MAITIQYRVTAKCDQCGKTAVIHSEGSPPIMHVPLDWIQGAPPGAREIREFCSPGCLATWEPDVKPWEES
jgi:hypothetical protein